MIMHFSLLRDSVTSTSVTLDVDKIDSVRRWVSCSIRGSSTDCSRYSLIAFGKIQDISGTDMLEEVTGSLTGTTYKIVNKRVIDNSHMEFDLGKK